MHEDRHACRRSEDRSVRTGVDVPLRQPALLRPQPAFILPLQHVDNGNRSLVGGKAASLARAFHANLPVPPAFCVTTAAFNQFLQSCPLELARLLSQVPACPPHKMLALTAQIADCLATVPMPAELEQAILAGWRSIGPERNYAVRSSANVEDGAEHSFAGQFESVLNVRGAQPLLAAIKQCWLSLFSARALAYHARERLPIEKTALAVLVQEMVPAEAAGVLFTLDPVSGLTEHLVIEAVPGLGDRLVAGRADPETLVVEKAHFRVLQRRLPPGRAPLDEHLRVQLCNLAKDAERLFARPLDIEWAAAQRRVFLLQARPATAIPKPQSWEDRQHWSNVNTGEIFPDVATPMTWSVVQLLLAPLFGSLFRLVGADLSRAPAAGLVAGRIYFNANTGVAALKRLRFLTGNLAEVARAIGGGETAEYVRGLSSIPDSDVPDIALSWPRYILSWPRILYDLFTHLPHRADAWMHRLQARTDALVRMEINSLSTPQLVEAIEQNAHGAVRDWDLLYLGLQAPALFLFQKACRDWLDDPRLTIGYRLFAGLGGVPEAQAGLALWQMAALAHADPATKTVVLSAEPWPLVRSSLSRTGHGRRFILAWDNFMSQHGHHCRGELELFNPRWAETPEYILGLVRSYLGSFAESDLLQKQQRLVEERQRLSEQCLQRLNFPKRWLFSVALRRAQKLAVMREEWKNQAVRQFVVLRRMLLVLGQRLCDHGILSAVDDIFFLEIAEIGPVAGGNAAFSVPESIRLRRDDYQHHLTLSPPSGVVGQFKAGAASAPVPGFAANDSIIHGIPVSPGLVTGVARVILHTNVHEHVAPGEILVAPFTDPAWTPYFIPAAGVVIEQGGVLSHGSIVARELGIPAVTSAVAATRLIRTGDRLHLDANSGLVTILSRAET